MEATSKTNAQLLGLPEKSADFFAALAADAGNWSGYPWLSGNIAPGRSSSGMSQTLVRAGLIDVNEDDGDAYASFTAAGCEAAVKLGFDLYDFYGYARPVAETEPEVVETPAEPVAETAVPAGKSMSCPECGYAFRRPQVRCLSRSACEKRQAARQGSLPLPTEAEVVKPAARAEAARPRVLADWLDRNPVDVLAEYVDDLKARHAAAAAAGSPIEPALRAQVAEQERDLAWVRARTSK